MKNKAKRIVSAVCALAMCAAMLPAAAMAADGETDSAASNAADTATVDETASDGTTDGTEPGADSQPAPAENSGIATLSDPVEDLTGDDLGNVLYVMPTTQAAIRPAQRMPRSRPFRRLSMLLRKRNKLPSLTAPLL